MTQVTGNNDPQVVDAIKYATELDSKGKTELAIQYLMGLAPEFPTAASIRGYLALFLYRSGQFEKAIEYGRQATSIAPKSEKASLVLFRALWRAGQPIEALDEMKRFLATGRSEEYSQMIREWDIGEKQK